MTLGMKLTLVQTRRDGTRHYKDENGNRLILYSDGSYECPQDEGVQVNSKEEAQLLRAELKNFCEMT